VTPNLGVQVAGSVIRDVQAYRDAAQQGTTVTRMEKKGKHAAEEVTRLFSGLLPSSDHVHREASNG
jgi:hypothetical protein